MPATCGASLSFKRACGLQSEAEDLLAGSQQFEVDSQTVLELVRDSDCSAYDCEFVALAMKPRDKLVTADTGVSMVFPDYGVPLAAG